MSNDTALWRIQFGERLKALRVGKGWTQTEAAREVGVTASSWSGWERGVSPRASVVPRIASAFKVDVGDLYGEPS